jgi:mannose/fructose/N-acetylgalactosamine-specific phosphotransferase system component IIC
MTGGAAESALVLAAGALLALDHAAWPSLLLAQPLLAGALGGAVLGQAEAGLVAGAAVQLLVLSEQRAGGVAVGESWAGGLAAAVAAPADLVSGGTAWLDDGRLAAPVAAGVLAMYLGRLLLLGQRRLQTRLARGVAQALERGETQPLTREQAAGIALHAGRGLLLTALVLQLAPPLATALANAGFALTARSMAGTANADVTLYF